MSLCLPMTTLQRITCFILSLGLAACSLFIGSDPDRLVRVKVVVDGRAREGNARWREQIRERVKAAADFFENDFGVRLAIQGIEPLNLDERISSSAELLARLKARVPLRGNGGDYDLVIGVTQSEGRIARGHARVDEIGNCAEGLGNYIAIALTEPLRRRPLEPTYDTDILALIHEFGHIFGAEHVQDPQSIMSASYNFGTEFDHKSREIILKNKWCPFRK